MKVMSRDELEELICGRKNALKEIIKAVRKMGGTKNMGENQMRTVLLTQGAMKNEIKIANSHLAQSDKLDQAVELLGEAIGDRKAGYGCKLCHVISIDGIQAHDHGCVAPKIEAFLKEVNG